MATIFYSSIMGWEWVLLLIGVNHSADKRQETGTPYYPLPPPSVCCIFTTYYYWGIWGYLLLLGYL